MGGREGVMIEIYRNDGGWGYNVNTATGGGMGGLYPFKWMAWLAAWQTVRRAKTGRLWK